MSNYLLPHFGLIDPENLNEYYSTIIKLKGKEISIDINFDKTAIDKSLMDVIKSFLENIENYDQQNKQFINDDYTAKDGDTVRGFVTEHVEGYGDDFLVELNIDLNGDKEKQFMDKLHLVRVGLYPDGKYNASYFAVFDYTVSKELTDQIIAVKTNEKGSLDHLAWES
ncbi:DUF2004 domain-containing protein [Flavobacterium notoginsengisoli]|uniref:DUF2004 domain-containing protein n=1 Tax=Flavobacterium notoginsengisoli TaxID=1478199 RepID=UPI00364063D8